MDPVMQTLFGKMPISLLPSVQAAIAIQKRNKAILILSISVLGAGAAVYFIYKKNLELRSEIKDMRKSIK